MARQKHVFANASDLIHIWANQTQDEGRSSNMSFRSGHIYSYSMMLASFRAKDVIFLNSRSSATSGHQSAIRSACSASLTVFEYNSIPNWLKGEVAKLHEDPCDVAPSEIWHQYRDIWCSLVASAVDKRFKRTASQRLALASVYAEKANFIAMLFTLDCYSLTSAYFKLLRPFCTGISEIIEAENAIKERKRIVDLEQCIQERMDWVRIGTKL